MSGLSPKKSNARRTNRPENKWGLRKSEKKFEISSGRYRRKMSRAVPARIQAKLDMPGFDVAQPIVAKYMVKHRKLPSQTGLSRAKENVRNREKRLTKVDPCYIIILSIE